MTSSDDKRSPCAESVVADYRLTCPSKDRLVRARKLRRCTAFGCGTAILSGQFYVDVDPPMRQNGEFALCIPCAIDKGYLVAHSDGYPATGGAS